MNLVSEGVLTTLHNMSAPDTSSSDASPAPDSNRVTPPPPLTNIDSMTQSVNSTTSDLTLQTLQRQMELMQSMVNQMQSFQQQQINTNNNNRRNNRRGNRPSSSTGNPNQSKYCWTHGLCSHKSRDCRTKADCHQDDATRENRIGGSMRNFPSNE